MVEIIKKGDKRLVNCLDCGSTLKFDFYDIGRERADSELTELGEYCYEYFIKCPECKEKIYVTSKITSSLERKINEREKNDWLYGI